VVREHPSTFDKDSGPSTLFYYPAHRFWVSSGQFFDDLIECQLLAFGNFISHAQETARSPGDAETETDQVSPTHDALFDHLKI
jgi:hypothetical protein